MAAAQSWSLIFAVEWGAPVLEVLSRCPVRISPRVIYFRKLDYLGYILVADSVVQLHCYVICPQMTQFRRKYSTQNDAVRSHARSQISVPTESSYATRPPMCELQRRVNNSNLPIMYRFRDMAGYWSIEWLIEFSPSTGGVSLERTHWGESLHSG